MGSPLTPKVDVDEAIDKWSIFRFDLDEKLKLDEQDRIIPNFTLTSPKTTKKCLPNHMLIADMKTVEVEEICHHYLDQDYEFDNIKLTNLDSITVNRSPKSDNELANKKYFADSLVEDTLVKFIQTLQNYLKVFLGNDDYNHIKYDRIRSTDTTIINYRDSGVLYYNIGT